MQFPAKEESSAGPGQTKRRKSSDILKMQSLFRIMSVKEGKMLMDLRVLNYFLAVAREENFTRAAQMLHVTQPTLSRQIAQLL